ncbi:unnamed protein product [Didymodactylos carnosus]|uniref:WW domain-containing protein n=1 Tax=Didymodactylos carnosus TaxID=1234261 RepID=A0A813RWT5_9BILA|nr:unnamed protein product [Didymodactylos carnosus]CAF0787129.1 unnamed protein product [Didymodactylos carnosus]CAF3495693.1 unnamed protein product [Didymodactylos carnosus]CAF3571086.1 unnamed protein product [Didymodactylos carnosus]
MPSNSNRKRYRRSSLPITDQKSIHSCSSPSRTISSTHILYSPLQSINSSSRQHGRKSSHTKNCSSTPRQISNTSQQDKHKNGSRRRHDFKQPEDSRPCLNHSRDPPYRRHYRSSAYHQCQRRRLSSHSSSYSIPPLSNERTTSQRIDLNRLASYSPGRHNFYARKDDYRPLQHRDSSLLESYNRSRFSSRTTMYCAWERHRSRNGRIYYYNTETDRSQWEKPAKWNSQGCRKHRYSIASDNDDLFYALAENRQVEQQEHVLLRRKVQQKENLCCKPALAGCHIFRSSFEEQRRRYEELFRHRSTDCSAHPYYYSPNHLSPYNVELHPPSPDTDKEKREKKKKKKKKHRKHKKRHRQSSKSLQPSTTASSISVRVLTENSAQTSPTSQPTGAIKRQIEGPRSSSLLNDHITCEAIQYYAAFFKQQQKLLQNEQLQQRHSNTEQLGRLIGGTPTSDKQILITLNQTPILMPNFISSPQMSLKRKYETIKQENQQKDKYEHFTMKLISTSETAKLTISNSSRSTSQLPPPPPPSSLAMIDSATNFEGLKLNLAECKSLLIKPSISPSSTVVMMMPPLTSQDIIDSIQDDVEQPSPTISQQTSTSPTQTNNLSTDIKKYYRAELIEHLLNWPSTPLEKDALRISNDYYRYSTSLATLRTDLFLNKLKYQWGEIQSCKYRGILKYCNLVMNELQKVDNQTTSTIEQNTTKNSLNSGVQLTINTNNTVF